MARCEVKTIEPTPPPREYVLYMNEVEARVLRAIFSKTAIVGELGAIRGALESAGLMYIQKYSHQIVVEDGWITVVGDRFRL